MTVKYKGAFKKDSRDYDGLDHEPTRKAIIGNPLQRIYAVIALDVAKVETITEQGSVVVPTMKIVHIEPQDGDDLIIVREMLDKAYRARTGQGAQSSLFDQNDTQASEDATHVADILQGALPFAPPQSDQTTDTSTHDSPPDDGTPPPAAPRGRGKK